MGAKRRSRAPSWRRRILVGSAAAVSVFLAVVGWSVGNALAAPGNDPVNARLAEWARDHGLGSVVVSLEKLGYHLNPPAVGGNPRAGVLRGGSSGAPAASTSHTRGTGTGATATVPMRPRLHTIATPALAGEGTWRALVRVHGQPAVQAAFLRPDRRHTSYLAGVVWMDHRLLSFHLHPGFDQPGGRWPVPDWVPPGHRRGLAATWNGAFKLADARGGFYLDGRTAGRLVKGAASEVFYRDGSMTVGAWGRQVKMTPDVVGVRQNLSLLVNHGRVAANVNSSPEFNWGATIGGAYFVFRSGVGVTRQGDLVYVSGDALSAQSLARLLRRAGCVRAMELDINPAWVSFMSYRAGHHPSDPRPRTLLPDYQRPANRYYTHTSRDFVTVYAR